MLVVGLLGSVTPLGRLSKGLLVALESVESEAEGVATDFVDLAEYGVSFAGRAPASDDTEALVERLCRGDAFIIASPIYRASMTGALKNALDLLPVEALNGKACGIVTMGATLHHYLGADWHLRDVLTWFGAVVAPTSVYLTSADFEDGELREQPRLELSQLASTVVRLGLHLSEAGPLGPAPLAGRRD